MISAAKQLQVSDKSVRLKKGLLQTKWCLWNETELHHWSLCIQEKVVILPAFGINIYHSDNEKLASAARPTLMIRSGGSAIQIMLF